LILDAEWTMTLRHLTLELFRTAQEHGLCGHDRVEQKTSYGDDGEELQLFGERMDRWFCPRILRKSARIIGHDDHHRAGADRRF